MTQRSYADELKVAVEAAQAAYEAYRAKAAGKSLATGAPMPDASEDDRASNVVPINARDGRLSRWFERVGELAMRRQVAMAAVFLLMIGVGLIFYQSHPRPTDAQDDRESANRWRKPETALGGRDDGNGAAPGVPDARMGMPMDASGGNPSAPTWTSAIASTIVTADPRTSR